MHLAYLLPLQLAFLVGCTQPHEPEVNSFNEMVMSPGMSITAKNQEGTITITADNSLKRSYTWDGGTRSATLWPRRERWNGSLGAYYPGPGEHWRSNNGVTRGVLEEGQQHFGTMEEALKWLRSPVRDDCVYRDDGLVVCWSRNPSRKQLNANVWQIYVDGKKPTSLPGSRNENVIVTTK